MNEIWRLGQGYTEEVPQVPTVVIQSRELPPGPAPPRRPRPRAGGDRALTLLVRACVVLAVLLGLGGTVLLFRATGEDGVDRGRVERWEDRLDNLDATAVRLFDPDLSAPEKAIVEMRLEHLQRSWCADLEPHLDRVPNHLRQAYGDVCEGG